MTAYVFTFTVGRSRKVHQWTRFADSVESATAGALKAFAEEYPGKTVQLLSVLTESQAASLEAYQSECAELGEDWLRALQLDWLKAGTSKLVDWAPLQQLRNRIGNPSKLPQLVKP